MSTVKFYKISYGMVSNAGRIHNSLRRNVGRATQQVPSKVLPVRMKTETAVFIRRSPLLQFGPLWTTTWEVLSCTNRFLLLKAASLPCLLCCRFTKHTRHVMISIFDHWMYYVTLLTFCARTYEKKKIFCSLLSQFLRMFYPTALVYT